MVEDFPGADAQAALAKYLDGPKAVKRPLVLFVRHRRQWQDFDAFFV